jgi:hypothetical protein
VGDISAVYEKHRGKSAVFFHGVDGYLHYYYFDNSKWNHETESFKSAGKVG